ncbi:uncharacterized protein EI90DRAFT_3049415 [Cantharellus anzutake]|uniref:uncharacterized protein n=1 Tax=Cantharellus anzutake TaxID=1750568 RepID=UPI001907D942|nr:uncharacterized protein EI90DRAFT_3049415 [Cantharellus anzutake]KAF8334582.1 hypothetical protein EI90DRAFT_3049415 [Cantharellus anzutake]
MFANLLAKPLVIIFLATLVSLSAALPPHGHDVRELYPADESVKRLQPTDYPFAGKGSKPKRTADLPLLVNVIAARE